MYDERRPQQSALGSDLGVFAHAWFTHALWLLGDESAALAHAEQGVALARRLDHMYSQTLALAYCALLHQMRRDTPRVLECAAAAAALCERYGFGYYREWADVLLGWAHGRSEPERGAEMIESAIAMAVDRTEVWWLPALYLQKSELEPPSARAETRQRGLELARAQRSRSLEQRILASSLAKSI